MTPPTAAHYLPSLLVSTGPSPAKNISTFGYLNSPARPVSAGEGSLHTALLPHLVTADKLASELKAGCGVRVVRLALCKPDYLSPEKELGILVSLPPGFNHKRSVLNPQVRDQGPRETACSKGPSCHLSTCPAPTVAS